jgi:hypothetical protein
VINQEQVKIQKRKPTVYAMVESSSEMKYVAPLGYESNTKNDRRQQRIEHPSGEKLALPVEDEGGD